jgi:hypothetical protein
VTSDERDPAAHHLVEPTFSLKLALDHKTQVEFRVSGRHALLTHEELEDLQLAFDLWLRTLPREVRDDQGEAEPVSPGAGAGKAPRRRRR